LSRLAGWGEGHFFRFIICLEAKMMKRRSVPLCAVLFLWFFPTVHASITPLALSEVDFASLGALQELDGWDAKVTEMWNGVATGGLKGSITSQPYRDSLSGDYFYFYQIENIGTDSDWHIIEAFTISPMSGMDEFSEVGYLGLGGDAPQAFASGQIMPAGCSINTNSGPTISYMFPGYVKSIEVNEVSVVLYARSHLGPGLVTGNIINGSIAQGQVVGPVPEPGAMWLLGLGICGVIRSRFHKFR